MGIAIWVSRAIFVFLAILLHVLVLGQAAMTLAKYRPSNLWNYLTVRLGSGAALFGFWMFALGHAVLLRPLPLAASTIILVLLGIPLGAYRVPRDFGSFRTPKSRLEWAILSVFTATFAAALLLAFLPPRMIDETQYHWSAPLYWAQHGQWVRSPYRLSNGLALAEMSFTFAAVFGSAAAGHLLNLLMTVILLTAGASLAVTAGCSTYGALAALIACPVIMNQAPVMYTDVFTAAFVVAAFACLVGQRKEGGSPIETSPGTALLTGLLLAAAISTKSFTIVFVPLAASFLLLQKPITRTAVTKAALICVPVLAALIGWGIHTTALTGHPYDSTGQYIARSHNDPMIGTGAAAARIPTVVDIIELPFVPLITPIIGRQEPYGGRTGVLLLFLSLWGAWILYVNKRDNHLVKWYLSVAAIAFFVTATLLIKTRFHIAALVLTASLAAYGFDFARANLTQPKRNIFAVLVMILMLFGTRDIFYFYIMLLRAH